jgi:hypothetical protein
VSALGWGRAATIELSLLPWVGILAMVLVDRRRLLVAA